MSNTTILVYSTKILFLVYCFGLCNAFQNECSTGLERNDDFRVENKYAGRLNSEPGRNLKKMSRVNDVGVDGVKTLRENRVVYETGPRFTRLSYRVDVHRDTVYDSRFNSRTTNDRGDVREHRDTRVRSDSRRSLTRDSSERRDTSRFVHERDDRQMLERFDSRRSLTRDKDTEASARRVQRENRLNLRVNRELRRSTEPREIETGRSRSLERNIVKDEDRETRRTTRDIRRRSIEGNRRDNNQRNILNRGNVQIREDPEIQRVKRHTRDNRDRETTRSTERDLNNRRNTLRRIEVRRVDNRQDRRNPENREVESEKERRQVDTRQDRRATKNRDVRSENERSDTRRSLSERREVRNIHTENEVRDTRRRLTERRTNGQDRRDTENREVRTKTERRDTRRSFSERLVRNQVVESRERTRRSIDREGITDRRESFDRNDNHRRVVTDRRESLDRNRNTQDRRESLDRNRNTRDRRESIEVRSRNDNNLIRIDETTPLLIRKANSSVVYGVAALQVLLIGILAVQCLREKFQQGEKIGMFRFLSGATWGQKIKVE